MKYLSFEQLSRNLGGRSRTTIYRDMKLGLLPMPIKIGRRVYWNENEVEAVLEALRLPQPSNPATEE